MGSVFFNLSQDLDCMPRALLDLGKGGLLPSSWIQDVAESVANKIER